MGIIFGSLRASYRTQLFIEGIEVHMCACLVPLARRPCTALPRRTAANVDGGALDILAHERTPGLNALKADRLARLRRPHAG